MRVNINLPKKGIDNMLRSTKYRTRILTRYNQIEAATPAHSNANTYNPYARMAWLMRNTIYVLVGNGCLSAIKNDSNCGTTNTTKSDAIRVKNKKVISGMINAMRIFFLNSCIVSR